ncbi:hypothetical protein Z043_122965 [Scleropages formosus]|uniref:Macro domain-containing protein n=1 Tax=Scleropages formosus TaxID=113540 RepID=A0A0P7W8G5_SCLFO|nr:hypothetical protein Z043_122965 [Scleropages formosus]
MENSKRKKLQSNRRCCVTVMPPTPKWQCCTGVWTVRTFDFAARVRFRFGPLLARWLRTGPDSRWWDLNLGPMMAKMEALSTVPPAGGPTARLLDLSLEERRKDYRGNHVPLEKIPTWTRHDKSKGKEGKEEGEEPKAVPVLLSDKVSLYKGDITILEVDAIVNAGRSFAL